MKGLLKGDVPNSLLTSINQTLIFESYAVWSGFKNKYQKDITCTQGIGLCAQNMITIPTSIININEVPKPSFDEHKNLHFD